MTHADAYDAVLVHLRERGRATSSTLTDLIGGNEELFGRVREELILDDLAEDCKGVGLKYVGSTEPDEPEVDLFVSYAHADDDEYGTVRALVGRFQALQLELYDPRPPVVFYDRRDIRGFDDWEHRILSKLMEAKAMLVVLSPAYFESPYCRKEWEVFLERERQLAHSDGAIMNLYAVEIPGFTFDPEQVEDTWMKDLARRQWRMEAKDLWHLGPALFEHDDAPAFVEKVRQDLTALVEHGSRVLTSRSTVPPPSKNFVGRSVEMAALRTRLLDGRVGSIVAAQGLGGMGKSALAFAFAQNYAADYPGGRYLVRAEGQSDLVAALLTLAPTLGVELSPEESRQPELALAKVHAALTAKGPALLVLDNVSDLELLAPHQTARALPPQGVHVLATSRLSPGALHLSDEACQEVGPLPESDAIRLLDRYRPFKAEPDPEAAEAAAHDLVHWLGGYALALETVAVYLWQHRTEGVSYKDYRGRLEREGFAGLEGTAADRAISLSLHDEKQLSGLLAPTLDTLSEAEWTVLSYASALPPDAVVWPWLRALIGQEHSGLVPEAKPGYPNPWRTIQDRLHGLRLLTPSGDERVSRMHRLVREVIRQRLGDEFSEHDKQAFSHILARAKSLKEDGWIERGARWELAPLAETAAWLASQDDARCAWLADSVFMPCIELGQRAEARQLLEDAVRVLHTRLGASHPRLAVTYSNLAVVLRRLGDLGTARQLLEEAIQIEIRHFGDRHPGLIGEYTNLGTVLQDLGELQDARRCLEKALDLAQENQESSDLTVLASIYHNLAMVLHPLGEVPRARRLLQESIHIKQEHYGPDHPELAKPLIVQAIWCISSGDLEQAQRHLERGISIQLKHFDSEHPDLAGNYGILAHVLQATGQLSAARQLLDKAIVVMRKHHTHNASALVAIMIKLAEVLCSQKEYRAARRHLEEAVQISLKHCGVGSTSFWGSHLTLSALLWTLGEKGAARDLVERAYTLAHQEVDANHPYMRKAVQLLHMYDSARPR